MVLEQERKKARDRDRIVRNRYSSKRGRKPEIEIRLRLMDEKKR